MNEDSTPTLDVLPGPYGTNEVKNQHIVSRVLLKQFAVDDPKRGLEVVRFDLDHPDRRHDRKSPSVCAVAEYFVPFDSRRIEDLWGRTEQNLPKALTAIDEGSIFAEPVHVGTLRDLMALHVIRSYRYRTLHRAAVPVVVDNLRVDLLGPRRDLLEAAARREFGRNVNDDDLVKYLDELLDESHTMKDHATGKLFRDMIEWAFERARGLVKKWHPELIRTRMGHFVIGDCPAITLRWRGLLARSSTIVETNVAMGDANTLILPLGPRMLLAMAPQPRKGRADVLLLDRLNGLQVEHAQRNVFFRPRRETEAFVRKASSDRPRL